MPNPKLLKVVPYRQSQPGFCGPAALRILLSCFGVHCSERRLAKLCGTSESTGTAPSGFGIALTKMGFRYNCAEFGSHGLLHYYVNHVQTPVLVAWWKGKDEDSDGHYSVVCGINEGHIWIADPAEGRVVRKNWVDFERNWFEFEGDRLKNKEQLSLRWWLVARES